MGTHFDPEMYEWDPRPSASVISQALVDLIAPRSVVDVGCGIGAFLEAFQAIGTEDLLGLDGEATSEVFLLGDDRFRAVDLAAPMDIGRRFDLALCFEVAEHLAQENAACLVANLVDLAPVVAFSAAHPLQGGQGHINERWPSYWHQLFLRHGYVTLDALRGPLADEPDVADFYRTNSFIYAETEIAMDLYCNEPPDAYMQAYSGALSQDLLRQSWIDLLRALSSKARRRARS